MLTIGSGFIAIIAATAYDIFAAMRMSLFRDADPFPCLSSPSWHWLCACAVRRRGLGPTTPISTAMRLLQTWEFLKLSRQRR